MENIMNGVKNIIDRQLNAGKIYVFGRPFSECQKVYKETNENIAGYMQKLDFKNKQKALSVLASGDHIFNLIYYGILNIDAFDTNCLTEYYSLGLKRGALLAFTYEEYLLFNQKLTDPSTSIEELNSMISLCYPYMEEKYRKFWQEIMEYNYQSQKNNKEKLNVFLMLLMNIASNYQITHNNAYLKDKESYELMRKNLWKAHITFECRNALNLGENVIIGYTQVDDTNTIINGHEITITGVKTDKNGKMIFICNDTDDNSSLPVEYSEDYLLPKIHHAALPQAVVANDVNLVENWVEGLKTYKELKKQAQMNAQAQINSQPQINPQPQMNVQPQINVQPQMNVPQPQVQMAA